MFFRVLKKDLFKKTALNIIMLIFIVLSTMFFSGSINSLTVSTDSLDKFLEISNAPDLAFIIVDSPENRKTVEKLARENKNLYIDPYISTSYMAPVKQFTYGENKQLEHVQTLILCEDNTPYAFLFDENDEKIDLKKGEIALPLTAKAENDIKVGDKIVLDTGKGKMEFTVAAFTKDAMFGSEFMSIKRAACSREDFESFKEKLDPRQISPNIVFFTNTTDAQKAQNLLREQRMSTLLDADKALFKWTYILNSIISIVFVVVSICLLVIAICILRFTILFTLKGDYREIGVLKAIGVKNNFIRTLYISKYLVLAVVGAGIGLVLSFPLEKMLTKDISKSFVLMESSKLGINIFCAVAIVIFICLFCFFSTKKLSKFSAVDAIRSGESGERFSKKSTIRLEKRKKMRPFEFLAVNDVLSNPKQFFVMIMTFVFGILILILPINAVRTLQDDSIVKMFGLVQSDYFMMEEDEMAYILFENGTREHISEYMRSIEDKLGEAGIKAHVASEFGFSSVVTSPDGEKFTEVFAMQGLDTNPDDYTFLEGTAPKLKNEIAVTQLTAEELGIEIGDTVKVTLAGDTSNYIVTATYQSMNNLGRGIRVNSEKVFDYTKSSAAYAFQIFLDEPSKEDLTEKIKSALGDVEVTSCAEFIENNIGSIADQLNNVARFLLIFVIFINSFVTFLMVKSFIMREKNQIGMLKSVGFKASTIKAWQIARIAFVMLISIASALLLAIPLNKYVVAIPFKIMGASSVKIVVDAFRVYFVYPAVIFAFAILAAALSVFGVGRISAKDINNVE